MKTFIVVTAIAIVIIVVFQSFTLMSTNKTEEQKYTVILKDQDFEIWPAIFLVAMKLIQIYQ